MFKKNKHFFAIKNNILNFTVLGVSNFGNFFSLIFLIFMSRNLSNDDFSLNSALLGTISLISFLSAFLTTFISKFVSLNVKKKFLNTFFFNFLKISAYSSVVLIMFFIFHEYIFIFFKFKDFKILFFCFSIFYFYVLLFYVDGFVLGNNRFIFHSGVFALLQFLKIVLLVIIVNFFYSRFSGVYSIFFFPFYCINNNFFISP